MEPVELTRRVEVEDLADQRLAQKISQLPGVGLVNISGGQRPAVRIQANTDALASYGLSLAQLRTAIGSANANSAKGSFDGPTRAFSINANDQLNTAADYMNLIVAYKSGAPIRLKDVATAISSAQASLETVMAVRDQVIAAYQQVMQMQI